MVACQEACGQARRHGQHEMMQQRVQQALSFLPNTYSCPVVPAQHIYMHTNQPAHPRHGRQIIQHSNQQTAAHAVAAADGTVGCSAPSHLWRHPLQVDRHRAVIRCAQPHRAALYAIDATHEADLLADKLAHQLRIYPWAGSGDV